MNMLQRLSKKGDKIIEKNHNKQALSLIEIKKKPASHRAASNWQCFYSFS
ncbi:hypothetical protein HGH93_19990 [Chitinophaga polysaccharea]|nr:hypothetical protein [Chitinophaga polysaccharea]NLR60403.1 hypothetical protein [Chitinophaga polysaccharea]